MTFVPIQTRSERLKSTRPEDFPRVTGREIGWKYSPVGLVEHLIHGELLGGEYKFAATPRLHARFEKADSANKGRVARPEDRASANAWAASDRVLVLEITQEETELQTLLRQDLGSAARSAHTFINVNPGCKATLLLRSRGEANLTENVEFYLGAGSDLTVITWQDWSENAIHLAAHMAKLERKARLRHLNLTLGGTLVRLNPSFHLADEQAELESLGLYFAQSFQHLEHQVFVNHDAPNTRSDVAYRGALSGAGARSVWIGDVLIGKRARGADSYEQNRNLILSEGARADSVPNLEIQTGDISGAGHASATTRFDEEHLFYLQARGIPKNEALRMVVSGFLTGIIQKCSSKALEEELSKAVMNKLRLAEAALEPK